MWSVSQKPVTDNIQYPCCQHQFHPACFTQGCFPTTMLMQLSVKPFYQPVILVDVGDLPVLLEAQAPDLRVQTVLGKSTSFPVHRIIHVTDSRVKPGSKQIGKGSYGGNLLLYATQPLEADFAVC